MDIFTEEKRRELMRKVKNRNTNIELILRRALFSKGYRYRVNNKLYGKPDIIFPRKKVAIFCDGDFWHGKTYKKDFVNYKVFWVEKIKTNMDRDQRVNNALRKEGWTVLRFWKTDILKNVDKCVIRIENALNDQVDGLRSTKS
jgi:DNA mismatch endonuclease Vsr